MRLIHLASFAAISTLIIGARAQAQELPEGPGKTVVQTACGQCHSVDIIVGQPRSRADWGEVVSRMVGNGAQLSDDEYNLVIEYLATHFGPASQNAPAQGHSTASTAPGGERDK